MARSGKKVAKFVTIPNSPFPGLYELKETRQQVPNPGELSNLNCPCCNEQMLPCFDVQQMGFWVDHYQTWFVCKPCQAIVLFEYELSRIEIKQERKSRKAAQREKENSI